MKEMANSLASLGEGAAVAVDTAKTIVVTAEVSHKVLTAVEIGSGGMVLVQTGATLLVKEGIKACAKAAAKELMQQVANGLAGELANYVADLAGITDPQVRQYIAIGVDAYQAFAFLKAARTKVDWNGSCFAAGTNVITGINPDGSPITRNIEEIEIGDSVLSRDQNDAGDDLNLRRVTQVFRKTSDHIRLLQIQGDAGNVETIRTTDEHPFHVQNKGWVRAGELGIGEMVQEADGTWQAVLGSERQVFANGVTVYNLEVAGDHTYFVEDGAGAADAVWVHNLCVKDRFVARMKTKGVYFDKVPVTNQRFRKRSDTSILQRQADPAKDAFVKDLGLRAQTDAALARELKEAGVDPSQFVAMAATGKRPKGFEVHHKKPLEWDGDNSQGNFILMRNQPYHRAISEEQGLLGAGFGDGEESEMAWPSFSGVIYGGIGG